MTTDQRRWTAVFSLICVLTFASGAGSPLHAQQELPTTGTIAGRVLDLTTGTPLSATTVQVVGQMPEKGATTAADGRYAIPNIPAGTITLRFMRLGYTPKTVTAIWLPRGESVTVDVALDAFTATLTAEIVTAAAERGTVREALNTQRTASGVMSSATAEQIAKSPDGDAARAAARISGVSLKDGKFLTARGQQDRATVASLNNARIPSPEPENKQVPFDMFPTSLIRSIEVIKTFTPDQPGDFSGAIVNIQTREFPSRRTTTYSSSLGVNASATGRTTISAPMASTEWLAFASGNRRLPTQVRAAGNFNDRNYGQAEMNEMLRSFRNSWTPLQARGNANSSFGLSTGGNDDVFGRQVGYIASLSYSASQEVRKDERRALIDFGTGDSPANEFTGSTGRTSVLWGGMLNASTILANGTVLSLNNLYNRTSDSEAHSDVGRDENLGLENILERSTLSYVERSIRSNQVSGQHPFASGAELDWSISNSGVTRREPDRSDMVYISTLDAATNQQNPFTLFAASADGARRTFADLVESSWNLASNFKFTVGDPFVGTKVKAGILARSTSRRAEVLQYSFAAITQLSTEDASQDIEEIFDGRYTTGDQEVFTINPLGQSGSYRASDVLLAAYAMADVGLTDRMRLVGGARVEASRVKVVSQDLFRNELPVQKDFVDALPSVGLNIALGETQQLRLSAARTLARPEYRELSPILNRDVLGGQGFRGDTSLVRTTIDNFDLRWEWYPNEGELVSVALFAKHHNKPIEKIEVPTSGTSVLSYINAQSARNYGLELEVRKELGNVAEVLAPFSVFTNLTLMSSEVRLGENNSSSATNPQRPLAGQAPYIINAGVTYTSYDGDVSATALFNRVGKQISAAGPAPLPDMYEMPRSVLDLSLRLPVFAKVDAKIDARNLLDSKYELRQGAVSRLSYTTGSVFSFGLTWKP